MKVVHHIFLCLLLLMLSGLSLPAQDLDGVLARLRPDAAYDRVAVLRQLAKMPADLRAVEPLMSALKDSSEEVRREALKTWGRVAEAYDEVVLQSFWKRGRIAEAQSNAAEQAHQNWQERLIETIGRLTEDKSLAVQQEAIRALTRIGYSVPDVVSPPSPDNDLAGGGCAAGYELTLSYKASRRLLLLALQNCDLLYTLVRERDAQVVYGVTSILAERRDIQVYPVLKELLRHPDPVWRYIGCAGLSQWQGYEEDLLELLSDPNEEVRYCALNGFCEKEELLKRLAPAFHQSSVPLRRSILHLISRVGSRDYEALIQEACRDSDGDVLADGLRVATNRQTPLLEAYVKSLLRHPHPTVRRRALMLVKTRKYRGYVSLLLPLAKDTDVFVRNRLIVSLYQTEDPRVPEALVEAYRRNHMQDDPHRIGAYVAYSLQRMWPKTEPLTRRLLQDSNWRFREIGIRAVAGTNRSEVMDWLAKAAHDPSVEVRRAVAMKLVQGRSDTPLGVQATKIAVRLLKDSDKEVQRRTILSLAGSKDAQARALLARLSRSKDPDIADTARETLQGKPGIQP